MKELMLKNLLLMKKNIKVPTGQTGKFITEETNKYSDQLNFRGSISKYTGE